MDKVKPVKLAYQLFEPSGGADKNLSPIIFLHGVSATKKYWLNIPQIVADRTKRKAYAIDARNHGDTEYTDEYSFDLNVPDLFHFMDSIQASKAILVGHSMGGITTMKAALKHPERIEKAVVEDIYTKTIPKENLENVLNQLKLMAACIRSIPKGMDEEGGLKFAVDMAYSQIPAGIPSVPLKEVMYNMGWEVLKKADQSYDVKYNHDVVMDHLENFDLTAHKFEGIYSGPALFIYGDQSEFQVGNEKEHIKTHFPNAEFIEFKRATHMVHSEHPQQFADVVSTFLQH